MSASSHRDPHVVFLDELNLNHFLSLCSMKDLFHLLFLSCLGLQQTLRLCRQPRFQQAQTYLQPRPLPRCHPQLQ